MKYLVSLIILLFLSRAIPPFIYSFYFTQDQGRDMVYARDILHGNLTLVGPQTSIDGVYHGVGWYYFVTLAMAIYNHPIAPLLFLVTVTVTVTGIFLIYFAKNTSVIWSLLTGICLLFFWPHYDLTRYAFNPFLLFPLFLLQLLLLQKKFIWAAIPTGLAIHAHFTAGWSLILIFILYGLIKRPKNWLLGFGVCFLFFVPHLLFEIQTNFSQLHALQKGLTNKSALSFSQDWQYIYLYPIILLAALYASWQIPHKFKYAVFVVLIPIFIFTFVKRFPGHPADDPGLFKNKLAAVDWVYEQANGQDFKVYSRVPSVYDYTYQYLFYWHKPIPCEYSTYPGAPDLFVPHKNLYIRNCETDLHFQISEPKVGEIKTQVIINYN